MSRTLTLPAEPGIPLWLKLAHTAFMAVLTPVNINYVYGLYDAAPQTWMSPTLRVIGMIVLMPVICCVCLADIGSAAPTIDIDR